MRSVAFSLALLAVLAPLGACRLLALGVACERDENCRDDERCVEGLCERQAALDPDNDPLDGGPLPPACPSPSDPKSERLVLDAPLVIDSEDALGALADVVVVEGDVHVLPGAGLTTVDLPDLVQVAGALLLAPLGAEGDAPYDASLPCLTRVGGELLLDHDAAETFSLPRLTRVDGSLTARGGYEHIPLPTLSAVGEDLVLERVALRDLTALTSLSALGGLLVTASPDLTSLAGLEGVTALPRAMALRQNPALATLDGLAGLTSLGGALVIDENPALPTCEAEALRERLVDGGFRGATLVAGNDDDAACAWHAAAPCPPVVGPVTCPPDAPDLNLLSDDDVANAVDVTCAANVVIMSPVTAVCLPALVEVSGGLTLGDEHTATHVELPALRKAGALYGSGASLVALSLPRLETVGGVELFTLPVLERVYLPRLGTVVGSLQLRDVATAAVYLPQLSAITGELRLARVDGLTGVDVPSLDDVDGLVALRENPTLTNVHGLAALRQAGGLEVAGNPALLTLDGVGLESVLGDITVERNARLQRVDGVDATLTFSGNVVNVRDNPCLPEADALAWAEALSPGAHNVSGNGSAECR